MSDFTIEQLEALKEGTTPGPWEASIRAFAENEGGDYSLYAEVSDKDDVPLMYAEDAFVFHREPNFTLAAAAPALVDALIAEKRKHDDLRQEIGSLIGKLETRAENAESNRAYTSAVGFRETAQALNRILEATDE